MRAHSNSDDRTHRVLHITNGVRFRVVGDRTRLQNVLINADERARVAAGHVWEVFDFRAHHHDRPTDRRLRETDFGTRLVIGVQNSHFLACLDGTGEYAPEREEARAVAGWYHLRDEHHKRAFGVAVSHCSRALVVNWTFVEVFSPVLLRLPGRGKVHNTHFEDSISSVKPLRHNSLEEFFALVVFFFLSEFKFDLREDLRHNFLVATEARLRKATDRVHNEAHESSLQLSLVFWELCRPDSIFSVEVIITPQAVHHLIEIYLEFACVETSEVGEGESPALFAGPESNIPGNGVHFAVCFAVALCVVGRENYVHLVYYLDEILVDSFAVLLKFKDTAIDLIND